MNAKLVVSLMLCMSACSEVSAINEMASCEATSDTEVWKDGTVVTWYAAETPITGQPKLYAEVCYESNCDENGRYPVTISHNVARTVCGAKFERDGKVVDGPPSYAIFKQAD